jgi:hypothetical protein
MYVVSPASIETEAPRLLVPVCTVSSPASSASLSPVEITTEPEVKSSDAPVEMTTLPSSCSATRVDVPKVALELPSRLMLPPAIVDSPAVAITEPPTLPLPADIETEPPAALPFVLAPVKIAMLPVAADSESPVDSRIEPDTPLLDFPLDKTISPELCTDSLEVSTMDPLVLKALEPPTSTMDPPAMPVEAPAFISIAPPPSAEPPDKDTLPPADDRAPSPEERVTPPPTPALPSALLMATSPPLAPVPPVTCSFPPNESAESARELDGFATSPAAIVTSAPLTPVVVPAWRLTEPAGPSALFPVFIDSDPELLTSTAEPLRVRSPALLTATEPACPFSVLGTPD